MPNVSLARPNSNLQKFPRAAKFPLARSARNLPQYTHAAQTPPRPRGLPVDRKPKARAPAGGKLRRFLLPPQALAAQAADHRVTLQAKLVFYFDWSSNMNLLNVIANLCNIGTFILSIKVYLENRRKRNDDAN
jgi:hypothetical protein